MPPKPPHEQGPRPPHPPPHEAAKKGRCKKILVGIAVGTIVAFIAGLTMHFFGISINVILPVLAPVWVGVTTLVFMALSQH